MGLYMKLFFALFLSIILNHVINVHRKKQKFKSGLKNVVSTYWFKYQVLF